MSRQIPAIDFNGVVPGIPRGHVPDRQPTKPHVLHAVGKGRQRDKGRVGVESHHLVRRTLKERIL